LPRLCLPARHERPLVGGHLEAELRGDRLDPTQVLPHGTDLTDRFTNLRF